MAQSFESPGGNAAAAFLEVLAQENARKRQTMLDGLAAKRENRLDEQGQQDRAIREEQLALQKETREQQQRAADQTYAKNVAEMNGPGVVGARDAEVLQKGGLKTSAFRQVKKPVNATSMDPRDFAEADFAGTAQQQAEQEFINDPNVPENQKAYMRARQASGGENIPYQLFEQPENTMEPVYRISADRKTVSRQDPNDGQWKTHVGPVEKGARFITEPEPDGAGGANARPFVIRVGTAQGEMILDGRTGQEIARYDSKPSATAAADMARGANTLEQMGKLESMFNPDWVGPLMGRFNSVKLALVGEGNQKGLAEFDAQVRSLQNGFIKDITGAQMSEPEAARIMGEVPNVNDPPDRFLAKLAMSKRNRAALLERQTNINLGRVVPSATPVSEERLRQMFGLGQPGVMTNQGPENRSGRVSGAGPNGGGGNTPFTGGGNVQKWEKGPDGRPRRVQ